MAEHFLASTDGLMSYVSPAMRRSRAQFYAMDADLNRSVNQEEYGGYIVKNHQRMDPQVADNIAQRVMVRRDLNGDGSVNLGEWMTTGCGKICPSRVGFYQYDMSCDNALTEAEIDYALQINNYSQQEAADKAKVIMGYDANGDGTVSYREMYAPAPRAVVMPAAQAPKIALLPAAQAPKIALLPAAQPPKIAVLPAAQPPKIAVLPAAQAPKIAVLPAAQAPKIAVLSAAQAPTQGVLVTPSVQTTIPATQNLPVSATFMPQPRAVSPQPGVRFMAPRSPIPRRAGFMGPLSQPRANMFGPQPYAQQNIGLNPYAQQNIELNRYAQNPGVNRQFPAGYESYLR